MKVIGLVGNTRNARRVAAAKVDAVVAQGTEAGGPTGRIGTPAPVPQVADAIAPTKTLAAGGIMDGRGLPAALALGPAAIWCGTAFLGTWQAYQDSEERGETDDWTRKAQWDKLVAAVDEDTRIGRMYSGTTMRHMYNAWTEAWERPEAPPTLPMPLQGLLVGEALRGAREAHIEELIGGPAGNGAGLIKAIRPATEVVETMVSQAEELIEKFGSPVAV